ncbi:fungal hydrophobin-domain-containing protein [Trametes meyenii]|nr:fungal hydrophobin-domain-containing protein [Trametes meyenii]
MQFKSLLAAVIFAVYAAAAPLSAAADGCSSVPSDPAATVTVTVTVTNLLPASTQAISIPPVTSQAISIPPVSVPVGVSGTAAVSATLTVPATEPTATDVPTPTPTATSIDSIPPIPPVSASATAGVGAGGDAPAGLPGLAGLLPTLGGLLGLPLNGLSGALPVPLPGNPGAGATRASEPTGAPSAPQPTGEPSQPGSPNEPQPGNGDGQNGNQGGGDYGNAKCNTGPIQCCNQIADSHDKSIQGLLRSIVGLDVSSITGMVGVQCSPITVIGAAGGGSCSSKPVCCEDNSHGKLPD